MKERTARYKPNNGLQYVSLNRFCPSVFFYLTTIVPCVWILELDQLQRRIDWSNSHKGATQPFSELNATQFYQQRGLAFISNISIVSKWEQTVRAANWRMPLPHRAISVNVPIYDVAVELWMFYHKL